MSSPTSETEEDVGLHSLKRDGSIISRTAYGTGWIIGWRMANRAIGFLSTLFLAHLLAPSDFGVVAMAMSFMYGLRTLSELGTENAIIRDEKHDRAVYDTGFTINVIRGVFVAIMLCFLAVPGGIFFHSPHLTSVVLIAAVVSLLNGFENIGIVDFRRFMAFEFEFKLNIVPRVVSATTAITLAFIMHNYWALIIAIVVNQLLTLALSYRLHPYRPRLTLSAWRRIASYSTLLWLVNLIRLASEFGTKSVIGRLSGMGAVGTFELGTELATLPSNELVAPLSRALFPGFAEIRHDNARLAKMLLRIVGVLTLVTLPAGIGVSMVATPLVNLFFGSRWVDAIPLIQILAISSSFTALGTVSGSIFWVQGWLKSVIVLNTALMIMQLVLLILLMPKLGFIGVAIAVASGTLAQQLMLIGLAMIRLEIKIGSVLTRIWRSIVGTSGMAGILSLSHLAWSSPATPLSIQNSALHLFLMVLGGATIYAAIIYLLWIISGKPEGPESEILGLLKPLFQRVLQKK